MKNIVQFTQAIHDYFLGNDTAAKQAVEANIAPVETDATSASKGYVVGEQLILNDVLYDVTATITAGDALTVGTNISPADDVASQIADVVGDMATLQTAVNGKASKDVIDTEYETIGSVALYPHTSGTNFYGADNKLYKATADIAVGDTLTVNTNCVLDNVVSALNDLKEDKEDKPTILTQTLAAGATTLTFTNAAIGNNSRVKYLSDPFVVGLITNAVQSGTTVTLTCAEQASAVSVKLEVYN